MRNARHLEGGEGAENYQGKKEAANQSLLPRGEVGTKTLTKP